jgi:hypothetical protein
LHKSRPVGLARFTCVNREGGRFRLRDKEHLTMTEIPERILPGLARLRNHSKAEASKAETLRDQRTARADARAHIEVAKATAADDRSTSGSAKGY